MIIQIRKATGVGSTELAAFDNALVNAGVANFNLVYLSSVIPPGSKIVRGDDQTRPDGTWGDKLYVVIAQQRTSQRNQEAWAGVGWMQDPRNDQGLLVEHQGHNEGEIKADIENSLKGLAQNRNMSFGPINMEIIGKKCIALPVCSLVLAVFESESWKS